MKKLQLLTKKLEMKKLKQYEELENLVGRKLNFITCPILYE